ncbi:MAG TPA: NAD(P)/FAD-dependent oxidoreductase [Candidatus Corynebacterium gallistercoris]|uniref:NAD(P)/FAD-dependent oxidoreductase n=1 Tax=Candidatus Corynebacterium gallistercoris TaxID=2838530 RepID=A0A9D1URB6_9CORY|nr:NAD(P)/FAD-dependent oxidoreductase [Candidatus Corynebacterium gallistercoris]
MPVKEHYPAIVIGAGQAGLAAAHEFARRGLEPWRDFIVLDSNDGPGGAWRHRWDSLTLGKAHGIADLPNFPMGDPDTHRPASDVVAEYYGNYEHEFGLPILRPVEVERVEDVGAPLRVTGTVTRNDTGEPCKDPLSVTADVVLSATGTWTHPYVPFIPGIDTFQGTQLHTVNFTRAEDFRDKHTLVVGGGMSAVQFLLQLSEFTTTTWATRRPPNFATRSFNKAWGLDVEEQVRQRTFHGEAPASVVSTTGIPQWPEYLEGVKQGVLVSRGMFDEIERGGVAYKTDQPTAGELAVPESWAPYPAGTRVEADVIFWNTGFRHALNHLRPLHLREPGGGIRMASEVDVAKEPRVKLVGYGSTASTIGATRAGRRAGREAVKYLEREVWK